MKSNDEHNRQARIERDMNLMPMRRLTEAFDVVRAHWKKSDLMLENIRKKEDQLERAKKRLRKHQSKRLYWYDMLPYALAEELLPHTGKEQFSISGPFGIASEVVIRFHDKGENDLRESNYGSLWLRPDLHSVENPFGIQVKSTESTNDFAPGTIGAINGLNHPGIVPPPDATIEWWIQFIQYWKPRREDR